MCSSGQGGPERTTQVKLQHVGELTGNAREERKVQERQVECGPEAGGRGQHGERRKMRENAWKKKSVPHLTDVTADRWASGTEARAMSQCTNVESGGPAWAMRRGTEGGKRG